MEDRRVRARFGDTGPEAEQIAVPRRPILLPLSQQQRSHLRFLEDESKWRLPDSLVGNNVQNLKLLVTRWRGDSPHEQTSENTGDYHLLSISLQPAKFSLLLGKAQFPNQQVIRGTIQLTRPALPARIVYHSAYDTLHLFIQNSLLKECFAWSYGKPTTGDIVLRDPEFSHDPLIEQVGVALLSCDSHDALCADALSLTIVARLLKLYAERPISAAERKVAALPNWRLRRALDYIESRFDANVSLAELAQVAGLSRMHFAAQFRKATGLRPHEYLLRCRVERAKIKLATSSLPIVEVALTAGFSSQSRFTDVFKHFTGLTPRRWRECSRDR